MRDRRTHDERGIGNAPGDDDLCAVAERGRDLLRALVDVGARERAREEFRRKVASHDGLARAARQVVAFHHGDARDGKPQLACQAGDGRGRAARVGGAEVAHDGNAVREAIAEDRPQLQREERVESLRRVGAPLELREGERALGEHLEDDRRRAAARDERLHHRRRRVHAVAGKAGAGSHREVHHPASPRCEPRRVA